MGGESVDGAVKTLDRTTDNVWQTIYDPAWVEALNSPQEQEHTCLGRREVGETVDYVERGCPPPKDIIYTVYEVKGDELRLGACPPDLSNACWNLGRSASMRLQTLAGPVYRRVPLSQPEGKVPFVPSF